jgi:Ca-activated chloride channel family protein
VREQILGWLGFDSIAQPLLLLALVVLIAALLLAALFRRPAALAWPALFEAEAASSGHPALSPLLVLGLRAVALGCLALVLAGPLATREMSPEAGLGLDLILVLDSSASMRALDVQLEAFTRTRLELAKQVVARFAAHRVEVGDRVGLVVFGERAFTQCPLTSDGGLLAASLKSVQVGVAGEATALGDALALAVKRVAPGAAMLGEAGSDQRASGQRASSQRSNGHVIVLLTDGRSNSGGVPVSVAAELARAAAIRVHTVGIGTGGDEIPMAPRSPVTEEPRFERHNPDLAALRAIADATGGRFFAARSSLDLAAVYAEIDSLERSARTLPPRSHQARRPEPLLAIAGSCLLCEIAIARVMRRSLP